MSDQGVFADVVKLSPSTAQSTMWITRDSDDETGQLCDVVEVWLLRPARYPAENVCGAAWFADSMESDGLVGRYTVEAARRYFGTVPETDRECIRIEGRPS